MKTTTTHKPEEIREAWNCGPGDLARVIATPSLRDNATFLRPVIRSTWTTDFETGQARDMVRLDFEKGRSLTLRHHERIAVAEAIR